MILRDEEQADARRGKLLLHCPTMVLRRQDGPAIEVVGGGTIAQHGYHEIQVTLYSHSGFDRDTLLGAVHGRPGQLIPSSCLFSLYAVDEFGREWGSNDLYLNPHFTWGDNRVVIRAFAREISSIGSEMSETQVLTLYSPVHLPIPRNQSTEVKAESADGGRNSLSFDLWQLNEPTFKLWYRNVDEGTQVRCATTEGPLPRGLDTRVDETSWFVFGRLTDWMILEEHADLKSRTTIRAVADHSLTYVNPPLPFWPEGNVEDYDRLYACVLRHVLVAPYERFHPLSTIWRVVLQSGNTTIVDRARALSVAVETVVHSYFREDEKEDGDAARDLAHFAAYLDAYIGSDQMMKRARGIPASLARPSTATALRNLVAKRIISDRQRRSWGAIRNVTAHRIESGVEDAALLNHCNNVCQALIMLIFAALGYEGQYVDHSIRGWPRLRFPRDPNVPDSSYEDLPDEAP
ncbi:MAG TPA: hypothetical protein VGM77_02070 [Gemmatimonadales bacterium]|jgi:hypothetical protein